MSIQTAAPTSAMPVVTNHPPLTHNPVSVTLPDLLTLVTNQLAQWGLEVNPCNDLPSAVTGIFHVEGKGSWAIRLSASRCAYRRQEVEYQASALFCIDDRWEWARALTDASGNTVNAMQRWTTSTLPRKAIARQIDPSYLDAIQHSFDLRCATIAAQAQTRENGCDLQLLLKAAADDSFIAPDCQGQILRTLDTTSVRFNIETADREKVHAIMQILNG